LVGVFPGDAGATQFHQQREYPVRIGQFHRPQHIDGDNAPLAPVLVPQQTGQGDEIAHALAGDLADLFADGSEYLHRRTDRLLLLPQLGLDARHALGLELEPECAQSVGGGLRRGRIVIRED